MTRNRTLLADETVYGKASPSPAAGGEPLLVFAAASLSDALAVAEAAFTAQTGIRAGENLAAELAKQIEAGAPAEAMAL